MNEEIVVASAEVLGPETLPFSFAPDSGTTGAEFEELLAVVA